MTITQVDSSHYRKRYDSKGRFISYWHQASQIMELGVGSILEIGVGNSFLSNYLRKYGFRLLTIDMDIQLKPRIVASALNIPLKDECVDAITCYQVLEHIPLDSVPSALQEMYRVTKKYLVLSLPNRMRHFCLDFQLYPIIMKRLCFSIPSFVLRTHKFDGEHYWEIGKKGSSLRTIKDLLCSQGFLIVKDYRIPEKPLHHFFILEKK